MNETVLVIDCNGQFKESIARVIRTNRVYSRIMPGTISAEEIRALKPIGIIITGERPDAAPASASEIIDVRIFELGIPLLGIAYGMQLMCNCLGGKSIPGSAVEYGQVDIFPVDEGQPFRAFMNKGDVISQVPEGFQPTARSALSIAAMENAEKKLYAVQFYPESALTEGGIEYMRHFLFDVCGAKGDYSLDDYIATEIAHIQEQVGSERVLLALSGGVDSSVCAALLSRALPNQLTCVFVDHGLMRQDEGDEIERAFANRDLNFIRVDGKDRFLGKLQGIADPERKRKIIGEEFIRVFEEEADKLGNIPFLAQGTIYPDIVESGTAAGGVIKSHHNVGGLPETLAFQAVVEPLSRLFKNEVRSIGRALGLPHAIIERQPFPGPGLAIRIIGEVTNEKLEALRRADWIVRAEIDKLKKRNRPDQYFAVLTDTLSVGIQEDKRIYDPVIAIRAIFTTDFMTCDYAPLSHKTLSRISSRITKEVPGVSRVVYDISAKPPATVEWE